MSLIVNSIGPRDDVVTAVGDQFDASASAVAYKADLKALVLDVLGGLDQGATVRCAVNGAATALHMSIEVLE